MIRTTDSMIKAVIVQKTKERLASWKESKEKALAAGAFDIADIFDEFILVDTAQLALDYDMLRNPAA